MGLGDMKCEMGLEGCKVVSYGGQEVECDWEDVEL